MSEPEEKQLLRNLRAAIEKKDPAERAELLQKLDSVERHLRDQPRLEREAREADDRLRKAKRLVFWGRLAVAALVGAVVAALAWFGASVLHLI